MSTPPFSYAEACAYLDSFVNFERSVPNQRERATGSSAGGSFDLTRVRELAKNLGDPQDAFPVVHIAGTKGKGSTCAFCAAILKAAGLRVGVYTSPHLEDLRERITLDGVMIPQARFAELLFEMRPALEAMRARPSGRRPTYFEAVTHLGFQYFKTEHVDVAVVEVGLGGRLDATNIVKPAVCGITHVGYDHMAILGNTLAEIAGEKAGILKAGVPGFVAPQVPEAEAAIEKTAREAQAPLEWLARSYRLELKDNPAPGRLLPRVQARLLPVSGNSPLAEATLSLAGRFQADNWALAVRLAQSVYRKIKGAELPAAAIAQGSNVVVWPGRLEEVSSTGARQGKPPLVLDGAHTGASVELVLSELKRELPERPLIALFSCAKDKDLPSMLEALKRHVSGVVFTHSGNPRSVEPAQLAERWKEVAGQVAPAHSELKEALDAADQLAGNKGVLVAVGSLFLVGGLKGLLNKPQNR